MPLAGRQEQTMLRRFMALLLSVVLISSQVVDTARAAFDEDFYSGNNILFYDPTCASQVSDGYISLSGKDNLEKILQFFMLKGLTLAQASGIAGNIVVESRFDPAIIEGGARAEPNTNFRPTPGIGFGIVQWTTANRQKNLANHIYGEDTDGDGRADRPGLGVDITDLSGQLSFTWKELSTDYSSTLGALKATNDPVEAAIIFHDGYERSADSRSKVETVRGGNARKFYDTYVDQPAIAGSTSDSTQALAARKPDPNFRGKCVDAGANGDLARQVLEYAWPQFSVRTDQMPAYADAVALARSENRYIGGNNGNDCGAFVTLLVRNSGFDTGYNSAGFGGNTILQLAWLLNNWRELTPEEVRDGNKQPGDVAVNYQHTYIYVGEIEGFGSKIASASLAGPARSPMAGQEGATDASFRWFRREGPKSNNNDIPPTRNRIDV